MHADPNGTDFSLVIPAKAGIQCLLRSRAAFTSLDTRLRGNDGMKRFGLCGETGVSMEWH
jgi:hypothetical protein